VAARNRLNRRDRNRIICTPTMPVRKERKIHVLI
jgi:hypothetical protein